MHLGKTEVKCNKHVNKDDVIVMERRSREVDKYVYLGKMATKDHDQPQEWKGELHRDGMHSVSWTTSCETKCANEWEESIQRMYIPNNNIWLWDLVA